jgi:sulfur carrier protein
MIIIQFNGETMTLNNSCSIAELLTQKNCPTEHCAVALNRHFIPRTRYATTFIQAGDAIELVAPMQGG